MTNPQIDHAADAVSRAILKLEAAAEVRTPAQEVVARILARIAAQDLAQEAVFARRREGGERTDDPGTLTIIAHDRAGLAELLPTAEAALASAQSAHDQARVALADARKELDRVTTVATLEAAFAQVTEHAEKLEEALKVSVDLAGKLRTANGSGAAADVHLVMGRLEGAFLAATKLGIAISAGHAYHTRPHWKPSDHLIHTLRKLELHEGRFHE